MNPTVNHIIPSSGNHTNLSSGNHTNPSSGNLIKLPAGKVIFVSAGPGDPDLLTVKALRWLQRAEIIITDRLVSPEIISSYATPFAQVIPVGKQGHRDASTPQTLINELLLEHAKAGRLVIRLKGGDISVFSNILDELQTLIENEIEYELVPGVTAALGAAAYAGIPLTARGLSTAVRFLTAYREDLYEDCRDLATTEDTLVFYMSATPVDHLVTRLLDYGIREERWIAVIEEATTPRQKVTSWPIHQYLNNAAGKRYASPTLIIIGRVAALHASFRWFAGSATPQSQNPPPQPYEPSRDFYFPQFKDEKTIGVC